MRKLFILIALVTCSVSAQQLPTRAMDDLNWMEFRQIVPTKVKTVLVTVGTLEPHGVINNGADNTAPVAIANAIAADINALVAPHIPYGVTGSMSPYPGAVHISEDAFRGYFRAVLEGMVKNGFKNIVVINGHGGGQTAILNAVASEIALAHKVNTLVINWWSLASDVTLEVFKEDGGHAGINETAFIQAINPKLVHKELYTGKDMTTANPAPGTWSAVPAPSTIGLYKEGQGWPKDFDQAKADEYYKKVIAKVKALVQDILKKWEMAGFN
ncbi:MAG: creatininase family protein [Acidobacteria bacterium]|nr:creatininase family protein [Acidobacteriota bacterium]MCL5289341.1 creatininase family protein [Acidobacteriota bacterium]